MKRTVTISAPTLVLIGVVVVIAVGVLTTTNISAQASDDGEPWILQPRRCVAGSNSGGFCRDDAYLFNVRTGEIFRVRGFEKQAVTLVEPAPVKPKKRK